MAELGSYQDGFEDWSDVKAAFQMDEAEPDRALLAKYEQEDWEGQAVVVYQRGERFYVAEGGYCSCYGLEGQWAPTEYADAAELSACLAKRGDPETWAPVIAQLEGLKHDG